MGPSHSTAESFVRESLRRWEWEFRRDALQALAGWDAAGVAPERWLAAVPELFFALASLQRPSWGHWNGLLTALRKARAVVLSAGEAEREALLVRGAELGRVLDRLDEPLAPAAVEGLRQLRPYAGGNLPGKPRRQHAFALLISLRNRIAHDLPADPAWWQGTADALRLLADHLAPAEGPDLPAPWGLREDDEAWAFNGLRDDLTPVFTSGAGAVRDEPTQAAEFLTVFRRLLGKADAQERDFRQLLTRLAPDELRGVVLGDYLMGPPVGEGGFARVHVGRQLSTGRKVALKVLHVGASEVDRIRFREEAALLARFNHTGIVQVLDHGDEPWDVSRRFDLTGEPWFEDLKRSGKVKTFIALEWVEGRTLDQVITAPEAERPGPATITEWFAQAAEALATVHAAGLLHRDVTPRNLMVTAEGRIKLMDFGIARDQADADRLRTQTGRVVGTPAYMSPEQLAAAQAGRKVTAAADLYALCATFYEVYTGRRLYDHDTSDANTVLLQKMEGRRPVPPRTVAPEVPWQVETLLLGGLEREPADRPTGAAALAADLRRAQRNEPTVYRRPPLHRRLQLAYRRNRTLAHVSLAFVLLLTLGSAAAKVLLDLQRQETAQQQSRADEEERARKAAEEGQEQARQREQQAEQDKEKAERKKLFQEYAADMQTVPVLWREARVDLLRRLLAKYEAPTKYDPRGFEWHYWRRLALGTTRTLTAPKSAFRAVRVGGGRLYTLDQEGVVRAYDLATLRELFTLPGQAKALAVTTDGRWLATGGDVGVALYDGETGHGAGSLGGVGLITCLAFPADGTRLLAGDAGSNLNMWSIPDRKFLVNLSDNRRSNRQSFINPFLSLDKHTGPIRSVAFSSDGLWAASGSDDGTVKIWDVKAGKYAGPNRVGGGRNAAVAHTGPVTSVAFSPDGRSVLSGSIGSRDRLNATQQPGEVKLWDLKTAELLHTLQRFADAVPGPNEAPSGDHEVAFSLDGTRLLACADKGINVWDARSGKLLEELKGAEGRVIGLAVGPDGLIIGAATDRTARLWKLGGTASFRLLATHPAGIRGIALSPDGKTIGATCEPGYGQLVGGGGARQTRTLYDGLIRLQWDAQTGERRPPDKADLMPWVPREPFQDVPSPDGQWHLTTRLGPVPLLSPRGGEARRLIRRSEPKPPTRRLDPLRSERGVDLATEMNLTIQVARFSPESRWLAGADSTPAVNLWEVASGDLRVFDGHAPSVRALAFSADNRLVATGDAAGMVRLWDTATGAKLQELGGHPREIAALAFSSDGRRLAVAVGTLLVASNRPGEVRLWDLETGSDLLTLTAGPNRAYCGVAFSPDGRRLYASANPLEGPAPGQLAPGELVVWDTSSDAEPKTKPEPVPITVKPADRPAVTHLAVSGDEVMQAAFAPQGDRLAVGTQTGKVRLLDVATGATVFGWDVFEHDPVAALVFSPGGGRLACLNPGHSERRRVRLLDPLTGGRGAELKFDPEDQSYTAGFSPDGQRLLHLRAGPAGQHLEGAGPKGEGVAIGPDNRPAPHQWSGVSPDGRWLVTSHRPDSRGPVEFRVWDTATGEKARSLGTVDDAPGWLVFSPDGGFAAVSLHDGTDRLFVRSGGVVVWRLATGERVFTLPPDRMISLTSLALSLEAKTLAIGFIEEGVRQGHVRLIDVAGGPPRTLPTHPSAVRALAFSPDGRWLATVMTGVSIWDLNAREWPAFLPSAPRAPGAFAGMPMSRRDLVSLGDLGGAVQSLAFPPDGQRVAIATATGKVTVAITQNARATATFDLPREATQQLAFSRNGASLLGVVAGRPGLWDAKDGKAADPPAFPGRVITLVDGGGKLGAVALLTEDEGKTYVVRSSDGSSFVVPELTGPAPVAALSPTGQAVAVASESELKVYTVPSGQLRSTLRTAGRPERLAFDSEGMALVGLLGAEANDPSRAARIEIYRLVPTPQSQVVALPFGPERSVRQLAVGRYGMSVAIAATPPAVALPGDTSVFLHGPGGGRSWLSVPGPTGPATALAFNPDATQLAVGGEGGQVWLMGLSQARNWPKVPAAGPVTPVTRQPAPKPPTKPAKPPTRPKGKGKGP